MDWLSRLKAPDYRWVYASVGAAREDIEVLREFVGRELPDDYVDFIQQFNGAGIMYRDAWYTRVWRIQDIPTWSGAYGFTNASMPGAVPFADDGGGEAFVFDVRPSRPEGAYPVFAVGYVAIGWGEVLPGADNFTQLLLSPKS
jgi:hypothetical protein